MQMCQGVRPPGTFPTPKTTSNTARFAAFPEPRSPRFRPQICRRFAAGFSSAEGLPHPPANETIALSNCLIGTVCGRKKAAPLGGYGAA